MSKDHPHIVFLGEVGFPVGFAAIQRQLLTARGMVEAGCKVTVISFKGNHGPEQQFPPSGTHQGVHYHYPTGNIHRPSGFVKRNWMKLAGRYKELRYVWRLKRSGDLTAGYVSTEKIQRIFLYWALFKIMGVPLVLNYDELKSHVAPNSFIQKWNDRLFDRLSARLSDGVTPISNYISDHVKVIRPKLPILKLPILCDFSKFDPNGVETDEISFTYCGAPSYLESITFVVTAFDQLEVSGKKIFLDFVLGGNLRDVNHVREYIAKAKNQANIRIQANITRDEVLAQYARASAVLIPLRPTVQDTARFPHKLGEYLASGKPVITTAFGEIRHYNFIDGKTALVAADYDPFSFSEKMQFILDYPDKARAIGKQGREMGIENFNYKDLGNALKEFILSFRDREKETVSSKVNTQREAKQKV